MLIRLARANALSLHHSLCSRAVVRAAHALGAPVLAWTANDPATVRRLDALGVDAIVSDDPGMACDAGYTARAVKRLLAAGLFVIGLAVAGGFSGAVIADITTSTSTTTADDHGCRDDDRRDHDDGDHNDDRAAAAGDDLRRASASPACESVA